MLKKTTRDRPSLSRHRPDPCTTATGPLDRQSRPDRPLTAVLQHRCTFLYSFLSVSNLWDVYDGVLVGNKPTFVPGTRPCHAISRDAPRGAVFRGSRSCRSRHVTTRSQITISAPGIRYKVAVRSKRSPPIPSADSAAIGLQIAVMEWSRDDTASAAPRDRRDDPLIGVMEWSRDDTGGEQAPPRRPLGTWGDGLPRIPLVLGLGKSVSCFATNPGKKAVDPWVC
ncbi:hypothetical protein Bbelb_093540 [Branchiostoma belcheri]|nr:hypothetical protein Bbelb_093540 [Branchiostoma belcheri]